MRQQAVVGRAGAEAYLRWAELPGEGEGVRVFLHGLGASATFDCSEAAAHPALRATGHRSLLVDLLGFGWSDRPADFGYTLEEHADTVAAVLDADGIRGAELVGHSMGGAVALALAARRPELVGALVLAEANLRPGGGAWSRKIVAWPEEEFATRGMAEFTAGESDPGYLATLRAADPLAVHRSAVGLVRGISPGLGQVFVEYDGPKAFLVGELSRPYPEEGDAVEAGAHILTVPAAGHPMPVENPDGFARAVAEASARATAAV
ncbi:alpha/beta hydrolase [Streptomyces sp. WMMB303]|uniref:alpha/beta fold hydrolase n=1 Tax=Streptomyces sp. WMMB303 TaxID=3034154 RepID=UPI0023EB2A87|nr:alpha/beta hydrolase [Streptomyces sp. WMMB303]MDF4251351.1 alpha/beta hydrolase [Streptomyces sp. WMMB303]